MALATAKPIFVSSQSTSANYDILQDAKILNRIKNVYPNFPNEAAPMYISIFLPSATPSQIKVNNGEWDDFLLGTSYDTGETLYIKSLVLSANNCPFHVTIRFE